MGRWSQHITRQSVNELQAMLESRSLLRNGEEFELSSGVKSGFYFNAKPVTMDPRGAELVGSIVGPLVLDSGANAVGGLELGAIWIATAVANWCHEQDAPVANVCVRDEHKSHGMKERITASSGFMDLPVKRVAVVDDVITTGKSTIRAVQGLLADDCRITSVITLVTRPEYGGVTEMAKTFAQYTDGPYISIFDCDDEGTLAPRVNDFVGQPVS
ncbi:MAG: hypothetical protein IH957_09090 [Chloroflexi bacterium]|nr:hypothetical protein [Chloroflexota bacterium]